MFSHLADKISCKLVTAFSRRARAMESINVVGILQEGMLTQGHAPDPKWCKLNISSFLALPHLLDCLICTRNSVSFALLLWVMGGWDRWGWLIYISLWVGGQGAGIISFLFVFLFCAFFLLVSHVLFFFKCVERDSCWVCFFV